MNVVCCGNNKGHIESLCNKSFCKIQEKRKDCKGRYYYLIDIDLDFFLNWINSIISKEIVIFTAPEIWINRKKVSLTIKINSCYLYFFEIKYSNIKNKIKCNFII